MVGSDDGVAQTVLIMTNEALPLARKHFLVRQFQDDIEFGSASNILLISPEDWNS